MDEFLSVEVFVLVFVLGVLLLPVFFVLNRTLASSAMPPSLVRPQEIKLIYSLEADALGGCGNIGPADVPATIDGASEVASEDCTVDRIGALLI